jgi:hypothetical protein
MQHEDEGEPDHTSSPAPSLQSTTPTSSSSQHESAMSQVVAWSLIVSGLLDVAWAISMKYAEGCTRPGWSILSLLLLGAFVTCSAASSRFCPW